jgi:hypothetical protein
MTPSSLTRVTSPDVLLYITIHTRPPNRLHPSIPRCPKLSCIACKTSSLFSAVIMTSRGNGFSIPRLNRLPKLERVTLPHVSRKCSLSILLIASGSFNRIFKILPDICICKSFKTAVGSKVILHLLKPSTLARVT